MLENKRVLCLGNNTSDTDNKSSELASLYNTVNHGLIESSNIPIIKDGIYHTSLVDCTQQDIQQLVNNFDLVYVFDQEYDSRLVKHTTLDLANQLTNKVNVIYENNKQLDTYWSDLVKENKSFCIYPFIELMTQNGKTTLCCRSSVPVEETSNLKDWQTNKQYQKIRKSMLLGEKIHHCSACYNIEQLGIASPRQEGTIEWASRLGLKSIDDLDTIKNPSYYEIRASNVCNLQCRMCEPKWSNQIEREWKDIGLISKDKTYGYTGFDIVKFDQLEKLYVAGGEPTVQIEFIEFLEDLISKGQTNFELQINTNATKINSRFRDIIKHFPKTMFTVSIDGYQDLNYYIRYPSKWDDIINNTQWIVDNNFKLTFNTTASVLNIGRLSEIFNFLNDRFPGSWLDCNYSSGVMTPFAFPYNKQALDDLKKITETNYYQNNKVFTNNINGLIKYFTNRIEVDSKKLIKFFELNDKLDKSRNIKLNDYRPELEQWRNDQTKQIKNINAE